MNVLLGVCGSIAAYKSCDLVSALVARGHEVQVIVTKAGLKFCPIAALGPLSKNMVITDLVEGRLITEGNSVITHIELALWADIAVVAPASADTMAKLAAGFADNALLSSFLALPVETPRLVFPAMNVNMWRNPITIRNRAVLETFGFKVFDPASGQLACGVVGEGKMRPTREIVELIEGSVSKHEAKVVFSSIALTEKVEPKKGQDHEQMGVPAEKKDDGPHDDAPLGVQPGAEPGAGSGAAPSWGVRGRP